ncbi:MAG: cyclic nucleotide-binding domain-containing protein, partial [Solirubrobacterales bacterium]
GLSFAATGGWSQAAPAFPLLAAMGVGFALVEGALITLTQRLAPDDVLARVFGVEETVQMLALGLGSVIAAALVAAVDVRVAIIVSGIVLPLTALVAAARLRAEEAATHVPERAFRLVRENAMFEGLPIATIENLALRAEERGYSPGQAIVVQGDIGDAFHIIAAGEVDVAVDGAHLLCRREGDFFGEIALLRGTPRMATVSAAEPVVTLAIGREHFLGAISSHAHSSGTADAVVRDRLGERGFASRSGSRSSAADHLLE